MSQKTRAQLNSDNSALFTANGTGAITGPLEQAYNQNVNDSMAALADSNAFTKEQLWAKGANINATSTLVLVGDGNYFYVTGASTSISAITSKQAGASMTFRFENAQTLVNGSDFIMPGGSDYAASAGEVVTFISEGSGAWRLLFSNNKVSSAGYNTVTKTDLDALIAANRLVPGQWYLISDAATSAVWARNWTVLAIANSPNSLQTAAWVVNNSELLPCEYDSFTPGVRFYQTSAQIPITKTKVASWGSISAETYPYCSIYIQTDSSQILKTSVSDDSSTLNLTNVQFINGNNPPLNGGVFGNYLTVNPAAPANDLFAPYAGQWTPTIDFGGFAGGSLLLGTYSVQGNVMSFTIRFTIENSGSETNQNVSIPLPIGLTANTDSPNSINGTAQNRDMAQWASNGRLLDVTQNAGNIQLEIFMTTAILTLDITITGQALLA